MLNYLDIIIAAVFPVFPACSLHLHFLSAHTTAGVKYWECSVEAEEPSVLLTSDLVLLVLNLERSGSDSISHLFFPPIFHLNT